VISACHFQKLCARHEHECTYNWILRGLGLIDCKSHIEHCSSHPFLLMQNHRKCAEYQGITPFFRLLSFPTLDKPLSLILVRRISNIIFKVITKENFSRVPISNPPFSSHPSSQSRCPSTLLPIHHPPTHRNQPANHHPSRPLGPSVCCRNRHSLR
jgi:hypothetical protein